MARISRVYEKSENFCMDKASTNANRNTRQYWSLGKNFFLANEIDRIYNDYTVIKTRLNLSCVFIYLYVSTFV